MPKVSTGTTTVCRRRARGRCHWGKGQCAACRLLTLEDTVEFFNLVLGTNLTRDEKANLVAFLQVP